MKHFPMFAAFAIFIIVSSFCCYEVRCQCSVWENLSSANLASPAYISSFSVTTSGSQINQTASRKHGGPNDNIPFFQETNGQDNLLFSYVPVPTDTDWGVYVKVVNTGADPSNNALAGLMVSTPLKNTSSFLIVNFLFWNVHFHRFEVHRLSTLSMQGTP